MQLQFIDGDGMSVSATSDGYGDGTAGDSAGDGGDEKMFSWSAEKLAKAISEEFPQEGRE
jgi:hypothetical protein